MSRFGIPVVIVVAVLARAASGTGGERRETIIDDFGFPWSDKPAPRTVFRAGVDGERLQFTFEADDADLVVAEKWEGESTVDGEDRVEIFFAKDADLTDYWCVEIDPLGRVHDYHARHYRRFDSDWNCPGLKTEAERTPAGYAVRGSVPLAALSDLMGRPIAAGSEIRVGLFRAEFHGTDPATRGEADDDWISWARPNVPKPDFHVPGAFKTLLVP